jgi:hypothetical protein
VTPCVQDLCYPTVGAARRKGIDAWTRSFRPRSTAVQSARPDGDVDDTPSNFVGEHVRGGDEVPKEGRGTGIRKTNDTRLWTHLDHGLERRVSGGGLGLGGRGGFPSGGSHCDRV